MPFIIINTTTTTTNTPTPSITLTSPPKRLITLLVPRSRIHVTVLATLLLPDTIYLSERNPTSSLHGFHRTGIWNLHACTCTHAHARTHAYAYAWPPISFGIRGRCTVYAYRSRHVYVQIIEILVLEMRDAVGGFFRGEAWAVGEGG
ncbi:predicted protein [Plenodomus lingam JN3]|uniref:Predicted protein n=1 Tax=Leptosphaeria maculans (strain JN3 / isolate v23.1.3 / race Av1-4-5-6-7-8) TaxID=985895 RepID=E5ACT8_LEPMJ|nr:predicted protein [Plenodomus lingam JN3]CBY02290.1 predicted protein [Plenodomus lingam JN3]